MQLAFVITIPALIIAVCVSVAYQRDICILILDWLQECKWRRTKLSNAAIVRLMEGGQKAMKSR
jgi:hypothetical protein